MERLHPSVFECLVGLLLKKLYPEYNFIQTSLQHDGGKDYYVANPSFNAWVEAKCHERHLELSHIAGTFVMADIENIQKVIIFSASKLTKGALIALSQYAAKHDINLIVYHGEDIQQIVALKNLLPDDYFKTFVELDDVFNSVTAVFEKNTFSVAMDQSILLAENSTCDRKRSFYRACACFAYKKICNTTLPKQYNKAEILSNKFTPSRNELENGLILQVHQTFAHEYIVRNCSLTERKTIHLDYGYNINYIHKISPKDTFQLEPGQCIAAKTYFRIRSYNAQGIDITPSMTVNDTLCTQINENVVSVKSSPTTGEIGYLPPAQNALTACLDELSLPERNFAVVLVEGKSGTGKSRFLQELYFARREQGNQTFMFQGESSFNSITNFFRQFADFYYGNLINIKEKWAAFDDFSQCSDDEKIIVDLLKHNDLDVENSKKWFVKTLSSHKVSLIVDNAQALPSDLLKFLHKLYAEIGNRSCHSEIVLAFNTETMPKNGTAKIVLKDLQENVTNNCHITLRDFDRKTALLYLKECLDPLSTRQDFSELYETIIKTVGTNPLFLKHIVLYLFQEQIFRYINDVVAVTNVERFRQAVNELPPQLHVLTEKRYELLLKQSTNVQVTKDILWSVLLCGAIDSQDLCMCVDGYTDEALRECVESGFIKSNNQYNWVFDHKLIAKSLTILLTGMTSTPTPEISRLLISNQTAKNYLQNVPINKYVNARFLLSDLLQTNTTKSLNDVMDSSDFGDVSEFVLPYFIKVVDKHIQESDFHKTAYIKMNFLNCLITHSQNVLGVRHTEKLFNSIVQYQIKKYFYNRNCYEQFFEFLKTYEYLMLPKQQCNFLYSMKMLANKIQFNNKHYKDDLMLWILLSEGKNSMSLYDFKNAKISLSEGIKLSEEVDSPHRKGEMYVQMGYLFSYLHDRDSVIRYWGDVAKYFVNSDSFYELIVGTICSSNAALLRSDYKQASKLCDILQSNYYSSDTYSYLQASSNDCICNYLIISAVDSDLNRQQYEDIDSALRRYRQMTLPYSDKAYLRACYKSLIFYKYVLNGNFDFIDNVENNRIRNLADTFCFELIQNYDWDSGNFTYFLPIFKDVAETVLQGSTICCEIIQSIPLQYRSLFLNYMRQTCNHTAEPVGCEGIFSDRQGKVHLHHYSYIW